MSMSRRFLGGRINGFRNKTDSRLLMKTLQFRVQKKERKDLANLIICDRTGRILLTEVADEESLSSEVISY